MYKNMTDNFILKEEVIYELGGLEIEDQADQTIVKIDLQPGQEQIIKLRATEGPWSISQSISTSIEEAA